MRDVLSVYGKYCWWLSWGWMYLSVLWCVGWSFRLGGPQTIDEVGGHDVPGLCRSLHWIRFCLELCLQFRQHGNVGKKATNSAVMGELGRYPLFLEVLLNMIKYWVRLSKINTSSTLLSECLLLSEALHKQNKKVGIQALIPYLSILM